jgi:MYXO-CTERM domain-containing protein
MRKLFSGEDMIHWRRFAGLGCLLFLSALLSPKQANAFCGFYVAGGESSLFNDATQVVLMRHGSTTVLSMQNNYQGPPENFAMIVPVENVLAQNNVKTLDASLFQKVDTLSAPRLVEYWEHDPCAPIMEFDGPMPSSTATDDGGGGGVTIEAQFSVGEYDIVVLSATDSTGLETWLETNNYNIPSGAREHFEPYVASGMKFFVAKVDSTKVEFVDGNAILSPLRIEMTDTTNFSLPIKLGLINSSGSQDLLVYTLGIGQRYDLANRPNVFIPTNIQVIDGVRENFGDFYRALFAETVAQNVGAAITEYAWDASTCDPCPGPMLTQEDFLTLGADVINSDEWAQWVITRLHLRYDSSSLGDDLVFKEAEAVVGGRERYGEDGVLEGGATGAEYNNFQGRYIIRHPWNEAVACETPQYDLWGGPDGSTSPGAPQSALSQNSGGGSFNESTESSPPAVLSDLVIDDILLLGISSTADVPTQATETSLSGCGCTTGGTSSALFLLLIGYFIRRRYSLS